MARSCLVALAIVFVLPGFPASSRAELFYSIHLASYRNLENANRHVNELQHRRDVVFWKEIQISDKGRFYRVYVGRFLRRSEAVAFWHQLKADGSVSYFGVHEFSEPPVADDSDAPNNLPKNDESPDARSPELRPSHSLRFTDNRDGTVIDTQTDLMWVKNGWRIDFLSAVNWREANEKCRRFRLKGYSDWRLPTIDEWKSLIDRSREYPAMVSPHPFENIIAHMPYWTATDFHPVSTRKATDETSRAYTVMMYYGTLNHQRKDELAFILPVRSIR